MRYEAYEQLVAPARPRSGIWRLVAGIVLTGAIYIFLLLAWFAVEMAMGLPLMGSGGLGRTPWTALVLLLSFLPVYPGLWLALRWLHRRHLRGLFGPIGSALRDARRVLGAAAGVLLVGMLLPGGEELQPVANLAPSVWVLWLVPALIGLFVQVTAEELIFRGYIQSQLAARFSSPMFWLILPGVLFGLLHYNPAEAGANALWLLLPPVAFGLLAGDLTARCGNLGPAIALHFANNFAAILLLAPGEALSGLALYRLSVDISDPAIRAHIPVEMMLMLILWLAARLALRK